jgi:alanyl-tRNA synthetase
VLRPYKGRECSRTIAGVEVVCDNRDDSRATCPARAYKKMSGTQTVTKSWTGNEIRETFLRFFESKGHRRVRSSSLVPHGDPTLLFTNAGMNQFKDVFLGLEKRDYVRAASAQKCVRAGGKHNDLENVGFTKRHHTFFEMLGNFSFGDYFKKEAIAYAWELVTSPEWFGIPKEKLYISVFEQSEISPGQVVAGDHESLMHWGNLEIPPERIALIPGPKENFWAMGDTGPCGPCSEIFYDMGPAATEAFHADCTFPCGCGRYVEIWNLVFMQFNRGAGGTLTPLPKPCVDTGMGLERVAAVLQSKISNYETDLFVPLMKRAAELCGVEFNEEMTREASEDGAASLRVIADHARATTFLITDGVAPSNEGRGYVLRKIMRRAIRHARLLGQEQPVVLNEIVHVVQRMMEGAYPELRGPTFAHVPKVVYAEEQRFNSTIGIGLKKLQVELSKAFLQTSHAEGGGLTLGIPELPGQIAFRLYDTYGLPRDFIEDACRDQLVKFDEAGFEQAMLEQKTRARASWKGGAKEAANPAYAKIAEAYRTEADFYYSTSTKDCRIEAIIYTGGPKRADTKGGLVSELKAEEAGEIVLDRTVIYAESGGQVADTGAFYDPSGSQVVAEVTGAYYPVAGLIAHKVVAKETLRVGDRVAVEANASRRDLIMRNHTGTHLVHAALRNILGTHVKQAGSLNSPERLRFDFSHFAHVDPEELRDIEQQVNDEIRFNTQIETNVSSLEDALASGALAFFGDKYPEHNVRVVTIPDSRAPRGFYSKELCGGTHVHRVGDIGVLKIVSEQSVAAGVRRIEAVTGIGALEHYQQRAQMLSQIASKLNVGEDTVLATVEKLSETAKQLEKQLGEQKRKDALGQLDELAGRVQVIKGVKLIAAEVQNVDREGLRQLVDSLRQKLGSGVVALGSPQEGPPPRVDLIAGVTKDLTAKVHAGKLIQAIAQKVGGSGGGRPDLAEAGGKDTLGLKSALSSIPSLLEQWL